MTSHSCFRFCDEGSSFIDFCCNFVDRIGWFRKIFWIKFCRSWSSYELFQSKKYTKIICNASGKSVEHFRCNVKPYSRNYSVLNTSFDVIRKIDKLNVSRKGTRVYIRSSLFRFLSLRSTTKPISSIWATAGGEL